MAQVENNISVLNTETHTFSSITRRENTRIVAADNQKREKTSNEVSTSTTQKSTTPIASTPTTIKPTTEESVSHKKSILGHNYKKDRKINYITKTTIASTTTKATKNEQYHQHQQESLGLLTLQ